MTTETKKNLELVGDVFTKLLLGVCIFFLVNLMNEIKETSKQVQDLKAEVVLLKYRVDDLTRIVRRQQ